MDVENAMRQTLIEKLKLEEHIEGGYFMGSDSPLCCCRKMTERGMSFY